MTHHLDIFMSGKNLGLNGLIIMLITVPFSPNSRGAFYPKYHIFTYYFVI